MQIINDYLDKILYTQLKETNMPYRFIKQIQDDIRCRMLSCLAYWNEAEVRKTILFVSKEEALFYEPGEVQEDIREFVVTTIRNSMLEIAASDDCNAFKIVEPLSGEQVKKITSEAVRYFNQYDMSAIAKEIEPLDETKNVYVIARDKYPLAWEILYKIANLNEQTMEIGQTYIVEEKEDLKKASEAKVNTIVCNGFTLEFDETLKQIIGEVVAGVAVCF